jgi:prepilin-type N-terminal cleavage/methylation domain-containing protein
MTPNSLDGIMIAARPSRHCGFTLLELLVAIAVVAILIGLVLPAVQKVRESAVQLQSKNQMRQIGAGLHAYAAARGHLPGFVFPDRPDSRDDPPLSAILPFVEAAPAARVALLLSPADRSSLAPPVPAGFDAGNASYAVNAIGFAGLPDLGAGFPDGTSNTIAMAEHYSRCGPSGRYNFIYSLRFSSVSPFDVSKLNEQRRATFADIYYGDVVPVPDGIGSVGPSRAGATFQTAPPLELCDPLIPQSPHASGMLVLRFDGSVRAVGSGVAAAAFWAAVTRAGGETSGLE